MTGSAAPHRWFRPPRLRTNEPGTGTRHATWLELFYDLVYVLVVAALAHELARHPTLDGLARFVALFIPVWWSWTGVTFYSDRFDTDDAAHRVGTLLMMLGAAALALSIPDAFHGPGFVLSYVFLRALLVANYARAARSVPVARPLARHYALGFSLAALVWLASLLAPTPWRVGVWLVAMVIDVATPLTAREKQALLPISRSHLPERIGLFMIIVLGESVAAIVRGVDDGLTPATLGGGALGLAITFSVWWVYFDNLDEHVVRRTRAAGLVWFYAHLPLVMGVTAAAVGVEGLVALEAGAPLDAGPRWLLGGGLAGALVGLASIHWATTSHRGVSRNVLRASLRLGSAAAVCALTAFGGVLAGRTFGAILALAGALQIVLDPPVVAAEAAS